MYRPKNTFTTPMVLLIPTYENINGVRAKTFPAVSEGIRLVCSFKTYGGTETNVNGVYSIKDTAQVETWYMPEITSGCRLALADDTNAIYEIIGEPENIDRRNQFTTFKVSRVKGGA